MTEDRIITLITRKLSGEASKEELTELENLVQHEPSYQYFEEILADYWNAKKNIDDKKDLSLDSRFNYILHTARTENNKEEEIITASHLPKKSIWLSVAVVAALLMIAASLYIFKSVKPKQQINTEQKTIITAKDGVRSKIILPDGTMVWLNSGSSLSYNNSGFSNDVRYVILDGEGFFNVTKDAAHPFIVHTSQLDIKVLGTVFNVKSYSNENTIEATLLKGVIEVERKDIPKAPKVILHPHEKFILNKEGENTNKSNNKTPAEKNNTKKSPEISIVPVANRIPDSSLSETSWIYNKLIFEGDTFQQLALKMQHWFNVRIYFLDDKTPMYRFSGSFTNETIEEALQALHLTASFTYKIKGNEIFIDKK